MLGLSEFQKQVDEATKQMCNIAHNIGQQEHQYCYRDLQHEGHNHDDLQHEAYNYDVFL